MNKWAWFAGALGVGLAAYGLAKSVVPRLTGVPSGLWYRAVETFGGRPFDPAPFSETVAGLHAYLVTCRADEWTALEVVRPSNPGVATSLGYWELLPVKADWPKVAALLLLGETVCQGISRPVELRGLWRPEPYNSAVGGKPDSAHLTASAVDLDFASSADRQRAETAARQIQAEERWLKMGIGVGARSLHLDLLTDKPQRPNVWCYESFPDCGAGPT